MSIKGFFGTVGLALLAIGIQLPVQAQSLAESDLAPVSYEATSEANLTEATANEVTFAETDSDLEITAWTAESDAITAEETATPEDAALVYPAAEESEVAQVRRRRTRGTAATADFVGIGADIGTTDDLSFAVVSKLSVRPQIAVRPSVLVGDGFAVLLPVTYEFSRFNTDAGGFQIRPYAGVGASYVDSNDSSDLGLLVSGGVDVPVSQRFTVNAQANYAGVFSDNENFGVTVGVGYNFGGLIGR